VAIALSDRSIDFDFGVLSNIGMVPVRIFMNCFDIDIEETK
jgi:hypothetical protein